MSVFVCISLKVLSQDGYQDFYPYRLKGELKFLVSAEQTERLGIKKRFLLLRTAEQLDCANFKFHYTVTYNKHLIFFTLNNIYKPSMCYYATGHHIVAKIDLSALHKAIYTINIIYENDTSVISLNLCGSIPKLLVKKGTSAVTGDEFFSGSMPISPP